jgi:poly(3-hydroxybutyrate) depolymerase
VKTIQVGGKTRQYTIRVPNNYNSNTKYKVIFGFHWRGGNMGAVSGGGYYDLVRLANEQVIFVAPNGFNAGWGNSGGEDVRFVDALVSLISSSLCVNPKLFFATGWSFGGGMSHSLACSRANIFRGVAVLSGAQISGCDGGNTPIAYLGIHGVGDSVLNVSNGRSLRDKWLKVNGCQAKNAPEPQAWTGSHIKTTYSCRAGYPVVWIAHSGDHISNPRDTNGPYWAPGETWDFFKQFS